ncbi:N-acetylmuramoyl-L-alanine amidase [Rhodoblastus acidophilus]|uniref:N-acetylmuramoyl-L-alanine amidase n=1 Tax=Rhodoblastus acidophilus TaxID=1074 RepID=A0A212PX16_RHOAC|nr:N-acetylmuramoyl-L-alanine amidase [Rhodoblastus acidophilus]PPQ35725.1 N-acetylmuramoyl-L-alanine amidase [Rhodoblastus acidophilus]RAI17733.1 N-acetylmuramoyl-L-alanine amidase [Rhodoblastus acidophilus]SNB51502.1 N-acetylmuramoyl-L-alanine amidase [Rhodoblastus acidophilus]
MTPHPDSPLAEKFHPSPNHGARLVGPTDTLILHYTGMPTAEAALELLATERGGVSCHYFVWEDGRIWRLVAEDRRAWHAGKSFWAGETDLNSRSIGIEIVHPGHPNLSAPPYATFGGCAPFPERQIAAVAALCQEICQRRHIAPQRVLAHSDIAPARKVDPGETFPWARLAESGVGLWVEPAAIRPGPCLEPGALGPPAAALQQMLAAYGYGVDITGVYDEATRNVVAAFQRHFRPALVDGRADASTVETLQAVLRARDSLQTSAAPGASQVAIRSASAARSSGP